jgi:uncharacterized protein (UPF0333 family)
LLSSRGGIRLALKLLLLLLLLSKPTWAGEGERCGGAATRTAAGVSGTISRNSSSNNSYILQYNKSECLLYISEIMI